MLPPPPPPPPLLLPDPPPDPLEHAASSGALTSPTAPRPSPETNVRRLMPESPMPLAAIPTPSCVGKRAVRTCSHLQVRSNNAVTDRRRRVRNVHTSRSHPTAGVHPRVNREPRA